MSDLPRPQGMVLTHTENITVASSGSSAESDAELNGITKQIIFVVPDLDDSDTAEVKLLDSNDYELYASGELAESTTHVINVERAMAQTTTIRVECSGTQAANRAFVVKIYYV